MADLSNQVLTEYKTQIERLLYETDKAKTKLKQFWLWVEDEYILTPTPFPLDFKGIEMRLITFRGDGIIFKGWRGDRPVLTWRVQEDPSWTPARPLLFRRELEAAGDGCLYESPAYGVSGVCMELYDKLEGLQRGYEHSLWLLNELHNNARIALIYGQESEDGQAETGEGPLSSLAEALGRPRKA